MGSSWEHCHWCISVTVCSRTVDRCNWWRRRAAVQLQQLQSQSQRPYRSTWPSMSSLPLRKSRLRRKRVRNRRLHQRQLATPSHQLRTRSQWQRHRPRPTHRITHHRGLWHCDTANNNHTRHVLQWQRARGNCPRNYTNPKIVYQNYKL